MQLCYGLEPMLESMLSLERGQVWVVTSGFPLQALLVLLCSVPFAQACSMTLQAKEMCEQWDARCWKVKARVKERITVM